MPTASKPENEKERIEALNRYNILDTLPEEEYDEITKLASFISGMPISLISLVDEKRQWFKSSVGIDASETHRDVAFCAHAILNPDKPLIVEDATEDQRFSDNDLVLKQPNIRFYAGYPLNTPSGFSLGTLCVIDTSPRHITTEQSEALKTLASNVIHLLELRKSKIKQERLIEKLSNSNKELEQFAFIASHDLQEPLRTVTSFVQLLAKRYEGKLDADADRFIDFAVKGCERMQSLIEGLLKFSRIESRKEEEQIIDCNAVLEDIVSDLSVKVRETRAKITWEEMPNIMAAPSQIRTVFRNLISNAIKYCVDRDPEVSIQADLKDNYVQFSIKDNGIGIEEQYQDKIFAIFKRLHSNDQFGGTGIGLAICKKIVERHGGKIFVTSKPEEGSIFFFTFPVADQSESLKEQKIAV